MIIWRSSLTTWRPIRYGLERYYVPEGKGQAIEDMAETGPDAIETLTSDRSSGDVDLADAKQRIGDKVCLFGGFNEHLLHEADADAVRAEVRRCLDAAMAGGGYVLRSTGQIFDAKPGLIEVAAETIREYGTYN